MKIERENEGEAVVLKLDGDLDVYTTADVERSMSEALEDTSLLIIDMSNVPFADSAGLGGLIGVYKKAKANDKEVRLRKPSESFRKFSRLPG